MSFFWLDIETVISVHSELVAEFGGSQGLRDRAMLESALGRPVAQHAYAAAGPAECAAAYAYGVVKDHPFRDGNKRTALACAILFLRHNGLALQASDRDASDAMIDVATGAMDEVALASWFMERIRDVR
jgi:death-on-curing protein